MPPFDARRNRHPLSRLALPVHPLALGTRPYSPYRALVIADGAASLWRFGEGFGATTAQDEIGPNLGAYTNAALGQVGALVGETDPAAVFAGTGYVTVPDSASLYLGDVFTLEIWVKRTAVGAAIEKLFSKGAGAYFLGFSADAIVIAREGFTIISTGTTLVNDATTWHHIVWTKSGATNAIYRDGVDVTGTVTNDTLANNATNLIIGAKSDLTEKINATLDEAAVYPVALSAAQVLNHYNTGRNLVSANLAGSVNAIANLSTGTLTTSILPVGSVTAISNLPTATLSTGILTAGADTAISNLTSATLTTAILPIGSSASISNLPTAALTTSITPVGSVAAIATLTTATLTTSILPVGSVVAVSNLPTATLSTGILTAGSDAAISNLTGALTTAIQLVGSNIPAIADLTGSLGSGSGATLVGTVAAVAAGTGAITTLILLAGAAAGVSALTADLTSGGAIVVVVSATPVIETSGAGPLKIRLAAGSGEDDWTLEMDDEIALLLILPS